MAALNELVTSGAALNESLPDCDARTAIVPAPVNVNTLFDTVAEPEIILKLTGRPELAAAVRVIGASPTTLSASAGNMIV